MASPAPPEATTVADARLATLVDDLPGGLLALAAGRWRQADLQAERAGLGSNPIDDAALERRLIEELSAPLRLETWPDPNEPVAVHGGWINDEVIDDDRQTFEALLPRWRLSGPDGVSRAAQELRLPVTPYRAPSGQAIDDAEPTGAGRPADRRPSQAGRAIVVDLTSHWAGPLATALLAETGAEVIKIDPDCRPDGFRARPALYHHLNGSKRVLDLDLRRPRHRERFESLVAGADLVVESFSRRVLPNLGYDPATLRRLNPSLGIVSIKAFPAASPEAEWLAYGPGVHAASGLGLAAGQPRPAPIAYPDLVAGVTARAAAVTLLAAGGGHTEVTLAGSIAPLVRLAADSTRGADG